MFYAYFSDLLLMLIISSQVSCFVYKMLNKSVFIFIDMLHLMMFKGWTILNFKQSF